MKIIPLSEGSFTVDQTKQFIPFDERKDELRKRPVGSLLVEVQPFVIVVADDVLLLDTGLGFEKNGVLQLHQNLRTNGIEPSQVTKVLLTHLHKDHAGGIGYENPVTHLRQLSFPNAKYFIQERELSHAFEKGSPSFNLEALQVLKDSAQLRLLKAEKGVIDNYIFFEVTAAHARYHQVFKIILNEGIVFFGGDDAPQLQHMKHRFMAKYDYNGRRAMELRKGWWQEGQKEKWTFLFYHDVKNPLWHF